MKNKHEPNLDRSRDVFSFVFNFGFVAFFLFVLVSDAVKKETLISGVAQLPFFATVRDFDKSIEKCFLQELQCTFVLCVKALVISWSF